MQPVCWWDSVETLPNVALTTVLRHDCNSGNATVIHLLRLMYWLHLRHRDCRCNSTGAQLPRYGATSRVQCVVLVLVLVLQVWCCVVKHGLVTLVVIMILKDTATFQVLFIVSLYSVLGTSLLWRSTVAFTYLKVKSAKCLCLLPVVLVLVLRIWSCLHHRVAP